MNKILSSVAVLAVAASSVSCSDSKSPDTIYQHVIPDCYAIVRDRQSSAEPTVSTGMTMRLLVNWTTSKADITLSGLQIGGTTYPTLSIEGSPWSAASTGWCSISNLTPVATTASGAPVSVSDLSIKWLDRLEFTTIAGSYDPGLAYSFDLDGRYAIVGSRNPFILTGTTETLKEGATEKFTTDKSIYTTYLDFNTFKATITIKNCCFAEGMPTFDLMQYTDIPFTVAANGSITLSCAALTPLLAGTPQPGFPITDLSGTITPGTGMTLAYTCTVRGAKYAATVALDYTSFEQFLQ